MKKNFFLWILAAIGSIITSCNSDEVALQQQEKDNNPIKTSISLSEAREDLESLLSDLNRAETRSGSETPRIIAEGYTTTLGTGRTRSTGHESIPVHIFNFENGEGYAVMSGDINYPSLIALSETGSYNEEEIMENPGAAMFYGNFDDWIILPPGPKDPNPGWIGSDTYPVYGEWTNTIYSPGGMCKVKWGQGHPNAAIPTFNKYCPMKNGKYPFAGCGATVVAQLMSVYKFPASYNGFSFNWDEMTKKAYYQLVNTDAQNNIARLMQQVGIKRNLDMDYGYYPEGSGANQKNCKRTFESFGYSSGGTLSDYTTDGILPDLKAGYPIIIIGYAEPHKFGHYWLGHGLLERSRRVSYYDSKTNTLKYTTAQKNYYILCNFGWDSSSDGYYLSNVYDTTSGPTYYDNGNPNNNGGNDKYYFKYNMEIITGIRK